MNDLGDPQNQLFHEAYGSARSAANQATPILILLADELILRIGEARMTRRFSPEAFHRYKVAAHLCVAAYLACFEPARIPPLQRELARDMNVEDLEIRRAIRACLELLEAPSERAAHAFAPRAGQIVLQLTSRATHLQIDALHTAAEALLAALTSEQKSGLHVVVAGDHQARQRSFGLQYFQRRLGEVEGQEDRVSYAENVTSEEQALALVATCRLDRRIARAFFDDEKRLQRDVLGDAATKCLDALDYARIP